MSFSDLQAAAVVPMKLHARPSRPDSNRPLQDVCNVCWERTGSGALDPPSIQPGTEGPVSPLGPASKGDMAAGKAAEPHTADSAPFAISSDDDVVQTPRMLGHSKQQQQSEHEPNEAKLSILLTAQQGVNSPPLASAMSRLGLSYGKPHTPHMSHTPASPHVFSFQTPTTARSGTSLAFSTPSTAGLRRAAASVTPRTPEERVLAVLADEEDAEELAADAGGAGQHSGDVGVPDSAAKVWGRAAGSVAASEDGDSGSSGDELDEQELDRMGLSPLSLPGSLCRTPVDDVIDCMLVPPREDECGQEDGEGRPASPVPFHVAEPPCGNSATVQQL